MLALKHLNCVYMFLKLVVGFGLTKNPLLLFFGQVDRRIGSKRLYRFSLRFKSILWLMVWFKLNPWFRWLNLRRKFVFGFFDKSLTTINHFSCWLKRSRLLKSVQVLFTQQLFTQIPIKPVEQSFGIEWLLQNALLPLVFDKLLLLFLHLLLKLNFEQ